MALRSKDLTILDAAAGTGMFSATVELTCAAVGMRARTICFVERDACAAACLVARMEGKTLSPAPIWDDLRTLDCAPWRGQVDCLCAGYPCQPFSSAGKGLAHRDPRHLWPAVHRAIAEIEPGIVFLENVAGHVGKGAGAVLRDLQELGYRVTAGLFSSAECGAPQERKRLFILAVADADGLIERRQKNPQREAESGAATSVGSGRGCDSGMAIADGPRQQGSRLGGPESKDALSAGGSGELADAECNRQSGNQRNTGSDGQSQPANGIADMGHANGDGGKSRRVSKSHQRRKALGTRCGDLPRYPPAKRFGVNAVAKAICQAPALTEARKIAADGIRAARRILGDWEKVAEMDPTRMPSIESSLRRVAAGMAPWSDEIRLIGNGVDPLCAAYAFLSLWACIEE